jgi:hypothetical protein
MSRIREGIVSIVALVAAMSGPTAFGAWLSRSAETTISLPPAIVLGIAGQVPPGAGDGTGLASATKLGTLFATGGVRIRRASGTINIGGQAYSYPGLETIEVGDDGLGVLRIGGSGTVFLCPGAVAEMSREARGQLSFNLRSGTARLVFYTEQAPEIDAGNRGIIAEEMDEGAERFSAEITVTKDEVLVMPLGAGIGGAPSLNGDGTTPWHGRAGEGNMWLLSETRGSGAKKQHASAIPIPAALVPQAPPTNIPADEVRGGKFLCRLPEIVENARTAMANAGDAPSLAEKPPLELPDGGIPTLPPGSPELALVEPSALELFDPNLLPEPAAGPGEPQIVVPDAAIPVSGTGGGSVGSPD